MCLNLSRKKRSQRRKKKSKVVGRCTEKMEEKARKHEFKDTEAMVQWRSINQEGINNLLKKAVGEKRGRSAGKVPSGGQQERSV